MRDSERATQPVHAATKPSLFVLGRLFSWSRNGKERMVLFSALYPNWLNPGDNAWQMTAATLVGLMSVPGLVVLYGGVMEKRWSINSMMLTFAGFATVLILWVLWAFKMGFGHPIGSGTGFFSTFIGKPGNILGHAQEQG